MYGAVCVVYINYVRLAMSWVCLFVIEGRVLRPAHVYLPST